jgi:hypothetical protein
MSKNLEVKILITNDLGREMRYLRTVTASVMIAHFESAGKVTSHTGAVEKRLRVSA